MEADGARNDTSSFVYSIMFSKRIMELLVKIPGWPGSSNIEVWEAKKMPECATWLEDAEELLS